MASTAEAYYHKITSLEYHYDYLFRIANDGTAERDWLEFKGADKIADRDIVAHWSVALSGFANTAGGVLIWGIDARRIEGKDVSGGLALHSDPEALVQRLKDVLLDAVSPPVSGVQIQAITRKNQKEGFVVCLIPEGATKAHRAETDKKFYMRNQDKFFSPPVEVIRSLFFPRSAAYLIPTLSVETGYLTTRSVFWITLENKGNLSATDIMIAIEYPQERELGVLDCPVAFSPEIYNGGVGVQLRHIMHPDFRPIKFIGFETNDFNAFFNGIEFAIRISCKDTVVTRWKCHIPFLDLLKDTPHIPCSLLGQ